MLVQPRLASAVMLLRDRPGSQDIEVFMVRRVIQSDFMPDVYVFPGGSVSKDDNAAELIEDICAHVASSPADSEGRTVLGSGLRAAAIRELFEEAGILLAYRDGAILSIPAADVAHFAPYREAFQHRTGSLVEMARAEGLTLATDLLGYFAHWITPEGMPKRFDTHFFITTAPAEQQAAHDQLETSEGTWISPSEALEGYQQGTFPLVFATIRQLRELAAFDSVEAALAHSSTHHVLTRIPILETDGGAARVHLPGEDDDRWDVPEHLRRT